MDLPGIDVRFTEEQLKRIELARQYGQAKNRKMNQIRLEKSVQRGMECVDAVLRKAQELAVEEIE